MTGTNLSAGLQSRISALEQSASNAARVSSTLGTGMTCTKTNGARVGSQRAQRLPNLETARRPWGGRVAAISCWLVLGRQARARGRRAGRGAEQRRASIVTTPAAPAGLTLRQSLQKLEGQRQDSPEAPRRRSLPRFPSQHPMQALRAAGHAKPPSPTRCSRCRHRGRERGGGGLRAQRVGRRHVARRCCSRARASAEPTRACEGAMTRCTGRGRGTDSAYLGASAAKDREGDPCKRFPGGVHDPRVETLRTVCGLPLAEAREYEDDSARLLVQRGVVSVVGNVKDAHHRVVRQGGCTLPCLLRERHRSACLTSVEHFYSIHRTRAAGGGEKSSATDGQRKSTSSNHSCSPRVRCKP